MKMAETNNNFSNTMESLFKGMDGFITTKTVVGDAIHFDDGTIILPLVDVSFGAGAGAFTRKDINNNGVGALAGKITPSSVLVIKGGSVKLVNIKNQDTMTKILDMIPDFVNKFAPAKGKKGKKAEDITEEDIAEAIEEAHK
jgi:uncharacterized spore protein YtfJ